MGRGRGWYGWTAAGMCVAVAGCGSWTLRSRGAASAPQAPAAAYAWDREGHFPAPAAVPAEAAGAVAKAAPAAPTHEVPPTAGLVPTDDAFTVESLPAPSAAMAVESTAATVAGYRVQVFASRSRETAMTVRDDVAAQTDAPVVLDFEPPYYKVRIGACENEASCRELAAELHAAGYASAFTVPVRIVAP